MSKKIFRTILFILLVLFFPVKNFAQTKPYIQLPTITEPEFSVSPSLIEIQINPGEKKTTIITVHNMQAVEKILRIYGTAFIGDRADASRFSQEPGEIAKSIIPWCKFPKEISMNGTKKSDNNQGNPIAVEIIIPKTAKAGEYYGTLIFEQAQKTQQTVPTAQISMSIGVILFITVKGDIKKTAAITNISINLPKISATILNKGNVHLKIKQGIARVKNRQNGRTFEISVIPTNQMPISTYVFPGRERIFEGIIPKSPFLLASEYTVEFYFDYQGRNKARKIQQFNISKEEIKTVWGEIHLIEVKPIGLEVNIPVGGKIFETITITNYRQEDVLVIVSNKDEWVGITETEFTIKAGLSKRIMIRIENPSEDEKTFKILFTGHLKGEREAHWMVIRIKKPEKKGVKKNAQIFNLFNDNQFNGRMRGSSIGN